MDAATVATMAISAMYFTPSGLWALVFQVCTRAKLVLPIVMTNILIKEILKQQD